VDRATGKRSVLKAGRRPFGTGVTEVFRLFTASSRRAVGGGSAAADGRRSQMGIGLVTEGPGESDFTPRH
jgi:hypothetical protein